jgi:hypothetical protein
MLQVRVFGSSAGLVAGLVAVVGLGAAGGCQRNTAADAAAAVEVKRAELPPAAPELEPLSFMAGQWMTVNANKSVNREHWMRPSGKTFVGAFQQQAPEARGGGPVLYELSAIVAEKDGVMLYLRHLHRKLEIDERRKDVDVFRLASVEPGKAVFVPVKDVAGGIASVTYRRDGEKLVQDITFKPDSKEKSFSQVYSRE